MMARCSSIEHRKSLMQATDTISMRKILARMRTMKMSERWLLFIRTNAIEISPFIHSERSRRKRASEDNEMKRKIKRKERKRKNQ